MPGVRVRVNAGAIRQLALAERGPVVDALQDACDRVAERARQLCPVGDGGEDGVHLRDTIESRVRITGRGARGYVGTDAHYAYWVHEGRGPVRPVNAKALRFKPKGATSFIFRASAGPAEGQPFLTDALQQLAR